MARLEIQNMEEQIVRTSAIAAVTSLVATLLVALTAFAQSLERPPYLQMQTSSSITVRWKTDTNTDTDLWYGDAPGSLGTQVYDATSQKEHTAEISGLSAGVKKYYSVGYTGFVLAGADADHYFYTAPTIGTSGTYRFVVYGDPHGGGPAFVNLINAVAAFTAGNPPDAVILTGDIGDTYGGIAGSGTEAQINATFADYGLFSMNVPLWTILGNHECPGDPPVISTDYLGIFNLPDGGEVGGEPSGTEAYYSFEYGNIHFVMLDTNCESVDDGDAQDTWLEADLAGNAREWLISIGHLGPYAFCRWNSDTFAPFPEFRAEMQQDLEAVGLDVHVSGHSHCNTRSYFVNGHYGISSTFNPLTHLVQTGWGGCCKGPAYSKEKDGPGTVYITLSSQNMGLGYGHCDHPANLWRTGCYPAGTSTQTALVLDIQEKVLDAHFIQCDGKAVNHFQIRHTQP